MSQPKVYLSHTVQKDYGTAYMFCKGGVYFGLDIHNARVMYELLGEIIETQGESNAESRIENGQPD